MKSSNDIKNEIFIEEYLSKNPAYEHWLNSYHRYKEIINRDSLVLNAKPFRKYKFNPDFIDIIFKALHNIGTKITCYDNIKQEFTEIENKLILFRDLLFYFSEFTEKTEIYNKFKSKLNYLTIDMLNFKYITKDELNDLKFKLSKFSFYIFGIDKYMSYYGIEVKQNIGSKGSIFSTFNISDITGKPEKSNLDIFEKAFRCEYDGIFLLNVENDFDFEYFKGIFLM